MLNKWGMDGFSGKSFLLLDFSSLTFCIDIPILKTLQNSILSRFDDLHAFIWEQLLFLSNRRQMIIFSLQIEEKIVFYITIIELL